jgi:polyisoprenyl-phosphate glycosyltransferase
LIAVVTFLSGVLLFFLGIIGEYVGRIYEETKARPIYVIERFAGTLNHNTGENPAEARRPERFPERESLR